MSVRTKVLGLVDVMMRVPPILVIDEVLKISMGLPTRFYPAPADPSLLTAEFTANQTPSNTKVTVSSTAFTELSNASLINSTSGDNAGGDSPLERAIINASATAATSGVLSSSFGHMMNELSQDTFLSDVLSITSVKFIVCLIVFLSAACIFMLWTRHLVMVYMFVISLGLTFISYWSNVSALALMENSPCLLEDVLSLNTARLLDTGGIALSILPHLVAQWFMGMLFAYVHLGPRYPTIQKIMPVVFAGPIFLAMLPLPPRIIKDLPVLAGAVPLILTKMTMLNSAVDAAKTVYNGYQYAMNFVSNFGLSALIENEWQRLNVPSVLRVFWSIRIGQELISLVLLSDSTAPLGFFPTMQKLLVDGCETLTAVLGMTSIISVICHYIGRGFQWYLLTFDNDEEKSLGTVSAVLFYILALQTGLTSLSPDKRFVRLCRNLCLLITALLHFLHNIVSPILMSLSAARNPSRKRHVRALTVCGFLVVTPVCLLAVLWSRHSPSTWLLAVTAFSVEVVVKVLVSLATYTLFLLDARRQTFWEKLDDYLYYVRAFGNSVEFCFGILLFFNGAWILVFESGGAIRAIMMCIHAYFNIWCEARAGWSVFMKRRSAVHKISALPEATSAQLRAFDDVCAICYQEMYSAKITRCRHYFHGVCLRKWLYVQDRCPLCHEIMMYTDKNDESDELTPMDSPTPAPIHQYNDDIDEGHMSGSSNSTPRLTSNNATNANAAATTSSAAAVAAAAASNSTQTFRWSPDIGIQE
ncbi:protein TRC8 homolog isoform X2 [Bactrocera oleae]|uniref:protein TRC8 homolog isoform X2 n=1 Tax=Bactrocera oleae TaxID=104688 RepID=UPI001747E7A9|nr:protein TRC8 homolog isoform X2 [Bactrocera oleae]XP_036212859.1 protein TRC8 homolog isoform X2 [Bactrocera oleae]XP_036212860.1 protein TRC8 homolog isoform X2 [Bactrocera oleae]XP_036212861.1 protein TRC8 homolog isoform X2 [Bactrocera oleae]